MPRNKFNVTPDKKLLKVLKEAGIKKGDKYDVMVVNTIENGQLVGRFVITKKVRSDLWLGGQGCTSDD